MFGLLISLISVSQAEEVRHEVSLQMASIIGSSSTFERVANNPSNLTGLRGGFGLSENLTIVGSWNLGITDTDFSNSYYLEYGEDGDEVYYEGDGSNQDLSSRLILNEIAFGPKFGIQLSPWLHSYATAQVNLIHGSLTFSDDVEDDDSLSMISASAMGFGGSGAVGVEFRMKPIQNCYQVASHLEFGGQWNTALSFTHTDENDSSLRIGSLGIGGLAVRGGVGVRF
jgi:hypothetical protein